MSEYYNSSPEDADKDGDVDEGRARYQAPQSDSTMSSDNVEMVKRLKKCGTKSMKAGKR